MTDRELMQMALNALEEYCKYGVLLAPIERREVLRARLAQPDETIAHWSGSLTSTPEFVAEQKATNEALRKMVEREPILPGGGGGSGEPTIDGWPLWSGLPQPEPEPVAWGVDEGEGRCIDLHDLYFVQSDADHMAELKGTHAKVVALYTTPPKKEWVGLTDEEARELCVANVPYVIDMVRALEAKLKEKNNG
jgi:hypothetical protein